MTRLIFAAVLLILAMAAVIVRKTFYAVPLHELKRRAEHNDELAVKLYRAAAYGTSLRGLLSVFIILTTAGGFVLLIKVAPVWLSLLVVVVLLWAAFYWAPTSKTSGFGTKLTTLFTPTLSWLLDGLHPLLRRPAAMAEKRHSARAHTGIFERNDLLKLIERQTGQSDNRLPEQELEIAKRALTFSDHTVGEVLTSRKLIETVVATETVGPILIDELHKSGQDYVLVKDKPKGMIVGSLELKNLGIHSDGTVADHMDSKIYYVHENDSLSEALHAFYLTNSPLFVAVNDFEEYVGIISVENILKQLLGHIPGDDFDEYADVAAVAARHTKIEVEPVEEPEDVIEIIA